jgi:hypothetical protein
MFACSNTEECPQKRGAERQNYLNPKSLFSKRPTKGVIIKK